MRRRFSARMIPMPTFSEFVALIDVARLTPEERKAVDDAWDTLFQLLPPDAKSELLESGTFQMTCDDELCINRKPNGNCACGSYRLLTDPGYICPEFEPRTLCRG